VRKLLVPVITIPDAAPVHWMDVAVPLRTISPETPDILMAVAELVQLIVDVVIELILVIFLLASRTNALDAEANPGVIPVKKLISVADAVMIVPFKRMLPVTLKLFEQKRIPVNVPPVNCRYLSSPCSRVRGAIE